MFPARRRGEKSKLPCITVTVIEKRRAQEASSFESSSHIATLPQALTEANPCEGEDYDEEEEETNKKTNLKGPFLLNQTFHQLQEFSHEVVEKFGHLKIASSPVDH